MDVAPRSPNVSEFLSPLRATPIPKYFAVGDVGFLGGFCSRGLFSLPAAATQRTPQTSSGVASCTESGMSLFAVLCRQ